MNASDFSKISFSNFKWLNEPKHWKSDPKTLEFLTDEKTDFWQLTENNIALNTGHLYGVNIKDDFSFEICVEANYTSLYDQAGLMIYLDEQHWLKAGIELNEGQAVISSVLTNGVSDWGTAAYSGNPAKFYLRLTRAGDVVCVKYSTDSVSWNLLRLCPFPLADKYFVGPMSCSPKGGGMEAKFSGVKITSPGKDILHSN